MTVCDKLNRVTTARERIVSKSIAFLWTLPSIPTTPGRFWLWAAKHALIELRREPLARSRIGLTIGLTIVSFLLQYWFGVRDWHLMLISITSLIVAFIAVNFIALLGEILSVPPRVISRELEIR
jgi:uncharacterized membrane protein YjjP (DUF1212 family)